MTEVRIVHPDPCWAIQNAKNTNLFYGDGDGSLCVFSKKELARGYIKRKKIKDAVPKLMFWDDLVEKLGNLFYSVTIDPVAVPVEPLGELGLCGSAPLIKRI